MHSRRMRTARSLPYLGISLDRDPPGQTPIRTETPWTETSPGQRPPEQRSPRQRDPLDRYHPPPGYVTAAKTLPCPKTSFAGGNNNR